ncbi:MAG: bifunctional folylpolyglutamate synthase/dihydrofolate synthase [Deltaproteobacteria bacterium]|nr:bifunctional folylpolyglutamate synthase/dihydrofolate synthase [Deltaproteobacteria bacterium]
MSILLQKFLQSSPQEWKHMRPGLERIQAAVAHFSNPQNTYPSLHIAGTNGKGSVSAMIHSVLTEAGYRVGLFTSPHLIRIHERFRVGSEEISDRDLENLLQVIEPFSKSLTFFEQCCLIAFLYFQKQKVDLAIFEVGLGGRLDATNILQPLFSIITEIGIDHADILGDTIQAIAQEKAGIIKKKTPILLGARHPEAIQKIQEVAEKQQAPLIFPPSHMHPALKLQGPHQQRNADIVSSALELLQKIAPQFQLSEADIQQGLAKVVWPGRLEWISQNPPILLDGAHNVLGMQALVDFLQQKSSVQHWKVLFSATRDKEISVMLEILYPHVDEIILCAMSSERSLNPSDFQPSSKLRLNLLESTQQILERMARELKPGEGLLVTGSLYWVGEVKGILTPPDPLFIKRGGT